MTPVGRRRFLQCSALAAAGVVRPPRLFAQSAPAVVVSDATRPGIQYGVQSGDVTADRAVVWSRSDRPARLVVDWSTSETLQGARRVIGPAALASSDYTARVDLADLPRGQHIFYRVSF